MNAELTFGEMMGGVSTPIKDGKFDTFSGTQTIDVGFEPNCVIIYGYSPNTACADFMLLRMNNTKLGAWASIVLQPRDDFQIAFTTNGFTANFTTFGLPVTWCRYIAIKDAENLKWSA